VSSHALSSVGHGVWVLPLSEPTPGQTPAQADGMTLGRDGRHARRISLSPDRRSFEVGSLYSLSE
jgi:hypothetical protein